MQILERSRDGTLLCRLTPDEARRLDARSLPDRKWHVRGTTIAIGRPDLASRFDHVVHAPTREEAERIGAARAIAGRGPKAVLEDVGARDVTGMTRGLLGWR